VFVSFGLFVGIFLILGFLLLFFCRVFFYQQQTENKLSKYK
jgi:hypothetical protein